MAVSQAAAVNNSGNYCPSITIVASTGNNICSGTNVIFTATAVSAVPTPSYQWQINGINTGSNSNVFQSTTLNNGDVVNCILTNDMSCSPTGTVSNSIIMTVNPMLTPSVGIGTPAGVICSGTAVVFTATPVNGGTAPSYEWYINGTIVGTGPSFSSTTLNNGDQIKCLLTSSESCTTNPVVTSNVITLGVNQILIPSISISANVDNICQGDSVTFKAVDVHGGPNPYYQWMINGVNAGPDNNEFITTSLGIGDIVTCQLTSDAICLAQKNAISNSLAILVKPIVKTSVSIEASANDICGGEPISFTAVAVNSGAFPAYEWQVNGNPIGLNNSVYTNNSLKNGDVVSCKMTSSLKCTVPVSSTGITMIIHPIPVVSVTASDTSIRVGQQTNLLASSGIALISYQWTPVSSLNNPSISNPVASPIINTVYQVQVESANGCKATGEINIKVFRELIMANSFTPNKDGKNDVFRIPVSIQINLNSFSIFDRWGNKVFETVNSAIGWDGTFKDHMCAPGTYVYFISGVTAKGRIFVKGTVNLIR